jgi:hypothetical protein
MCGGLAKDEEGIAIHLHAASGSEQANALRRVDRRLNEKRIAQARSMTATPSLSFGSVLSPEFCMVGRSLVKPEFYEMTEGNRWGFGQTP